MCALTLRFTTQLAKNLIGKNIFSPKKMLSHLFSWILVQSKYLHLLKAQVAAMFYYLGIVSVFLMQPSVPLLSLLVFCYNKDMFYLLVTGDEIKQTYLVISIQHNSASFRIRDANSNNFMALGLVYTAT